MRLVELTVGSVMGRGGNETGRGGRRNDLAMPGEGRFQLDTDFQVDLLVLTVPVNRDVPTCPCDLLGAEDTPDRATGGWNDLG